MCGKSAHRECSLGLVIARQMDGSCAQPLVYIILVARLCEHEQGQRDFELVVRSLGDNSLQEEQALVQDRRDAGHYCTRYVACLLYTSDAADE